MLSKYSLKDLFFYGSILLLPMVLINATFLIVLSIFLLILSAIPFFKLPNLKEVPVLIYVVAGFYIFHIIGLIGTENLGAAHKDLETKFSFILFPVLYLFTYRSINSKAINFAKWGVILGSLIAMVLSLMLASQCWFQGYYRCFSPENFGYQMHGTYLSAIYLMAAVFVAYLKASNWKMILFKIVFTILFLISIVYIRSLSGAICMLVMVVVYLYRWVKAIKTNWLKVVLFSIPIVLVLGLYQMKSIRYDFIKTENVVEQYITDRDAFIAGNVNDMSSSTVRMVLYSFNIDIIKNNPLGVGIGDVKGVLADKYLDEGYTKYAEKKLNSHSQILQTGVALGVIGIIFILFILSYPVIIRKKMRHKEFFYFAIIILVSSLFESFLERQVGVIFYCFILYLFVQPKKLKIRE